MIANSDELSQTDAEFLHEVRAQPNDKTLILAIRRVLAAWCGLAPCHIRADASTRHLHDRMKSGWARGWDDTGFLLKLEEELHTVIDMNTRLPPFVSGNLPEQKPGRF